MSLLLLFNGGSAYSPASVTFVDQNNNALPAGVLAKLYVGSNVVQTPSISGYLPFGATMTISGGTQYVVEFLGSQAPSTLATFTATVTGNVICQVPYYASASLNQAGYAALQTQLWPTGWFSDAARSSGGVAYNLASGLGWADAQIDEQNQITTSAMRLQSSYSTMIDSWAYDFFGNTLPRNPGESDASYIGRIEAMLSAKQSTPSGVELVAGFFGTAWIDEPWRTTETGAWDTNGVFAWDSVGGWGSQTAGIQVYIKLNAGVSSTQAKSSIFASRPVGMPAEVISVTGTNGTIL